MSVSCSSGLIPLTLSSSYFLALNLAMRILRLSLNDRLLTMNLGCKRLFSFAAMSSHIFPLSGLPFLVSYRSDALTYLKIMFHAGFSIPLYSKKGVRIRNEMKALFIELHNAIRTLMSHGSKIF